jgi:DNA-directed RNA polymerase specialized sigma24 family protein
MLRHNVPAEELGTVDIAEPAIDWSKTLTQHLEEAMVAGVINEDEAEVIEMTRLGGCSLMQWSELTGEPYDRLKKRRFRAETRLRRYFAGAGGIE